MFVSLFQALVNGDINAYLIRGLSPSTEYEVLLAAIYGNEVESDEVILVESTGKITSPQVLLKCRVVLWLLCQLLIMTEPLCRLS